MQQAKRCSSGACGNSPAGKSARLALNASGVRSACVVAGACWWYGNQYMQRVCLRNARRTREQRATRSAGVMRNPRSASTPEHKTARAHR